MMSRHGPPQRTHTAQIDLSRKRQISEIEKRVGFEKCISQNPEEILAKLKLHYDNNQPKSIPNPKMYHKKIAFRTLISSIGSALWDDSVMNDMQFLANLRKLTPQNAFTIVTMPSHLVTSRHRRYFDSCFRLVSLTAQLLPTNEDFVPSRIRKMGYHGALNI